MTSTTCTHEDCDCLTCETCGAHFPEGEGEGETETVRFAVGYDDYDYETIAFCSACSAKRKAEAERFVPPVFDDPTGEDDIPF